MAGKGDRGKKFEREVGRFFQYAKRFTHSFDNVGLAQRRAIKVTDRLGNWRGLCVLAECKETVEPRIAYSRVEPHQNANLTRNHENGGISLVLVKFTAVGPAGEPARAWAIPITLWNSLANLGDRASLSLIDGQRPPALWELEWTQVREMSFYLPGTPNEETWDLKPALEHMAVDRLTHLVLELGTQIAKRSMVNPIVFARFPELKAELEEAQRELAAARQAYAESEDHGVAQLRRADRLQTELGKGHEEGFTAGFLVGMEAERTRWTHSEHPPGGRHLCVAEAVTAYLTNRKETSTL